VALWIPSDDHQLFLLLVLFDSLATWFYFPLLYLIDASVRLFSGFIYNGFTCVLRLTPVSWFVLILLSFSLSPFSSDLLRYQRLSGNRYCLARMRDKSHRCHQCYISRKVNNEDSEREVRTNFLQIFTCYLHLLLTHNLLVDQFIVRSMTLSRLGYHVPKRYRARSHLQTF